MFRHNADITRNESHMLGELDDGVNKLPCIEIYAVVRCDAGLVLQYCLFKAIVAE